MFVNNIYFWHFSKTTKDSLRLCTFSFVETKVTSCVSPIGCFDRRQFFLPFILCLPLTTDVSTVKFDIFWRNLNAVTYFHFKQFSMWITQQQCIRALNLTFDNDLPSRTIFYLHVFDFRGDCILVLRKPRDNLQFTTESSLGTVFLPPPGH